MQKRMNYVIARQRNEAQSLVFRRLVSAFRKEQLIFLDESSKDERTTQVNLHVMWYRSDAAKTARQ